MAPVLSEMNSWNHCEEMGMSRIVKDGTWTSRVVFHRTTSGLGDADLKTESADTVMTKGYKILIEDLIPPINWL